jgi:hypothetical protein
MGSVIFMRRLSNRYLLNRFVSLSSALAAQQSSGGLETNHAVVENVRKIYSLSVSQAPRIGVEEVRGTIDLKDGYSRQQRWYARSNCEKARADGDDMATQMIKYAATSRNQGKAVLFDEDQTSKNHLTTCANTHHLLVVKEGRN